MTVLGLKDDDDGGPSTGTPAKSKYSSNFAFVMDTKFVGGEAPQPTWAGVCFHGNTTFPETMLSFPELLSWHISKWPCSPTSPTEQRLTVFHKIFITGFLSQGFYQRVFITGFFPLWSESQQKLWSGRMILLLLHAWRQKWKDAKKWIKNHISHFQLSKIILFIRFSSSSGGIFTLTVWETSYFSLPVSEFPELMVCLTVPCVAKWADKNHARYLRYQRSSPKWQRFKCMERESTKSRQSHHIKKINSKRWIKSCGNT